MEDTLISPRDRRKTLSINEVAEILGWDTETVRRDAILGAIPGAFQVRPGGKWRFKRSIVEAWWQKQGLPK
jgi:excisionase family DNA binding protein